MSELKNQNPWGRVDDTNTVYVKDGDSERVVGQYPDGTEQEALAYFVRKFDDLEGQIRILEQRINTKSATADVSDTITKMFEQLKSPAAVGDLQSLRDRVQKLQDRAKEFVEELEKERAELKAEALKLRESIVSQAEEIAATPEESIRWKETTQKMEALFKEWQAAQKQGPKIAKAQADELWKRFRAARNTFDSGKRKFFAKLDASNKAVKADKEILIKKAEELAEKGADGIPQYRALLEDWKNAGRASRKLDDQLWARFKAAGDVLYQEKAEIQAKTDEEYEANLKIKEELLEKGAPILEEKDHAKARKLLSDFLDEWEKVGRVPRAALRATEDRLRAIERHVQKLEDDHWHATNPETIARSEGLKGQLEDSIAALEAKIAEAKIAGNDKQLKDLEAQLKTQQSWLQAIN